MMLVVVSHTEICQQEAALINALFDEGLQLFHLRKPMASQNQAEQLLEKLYPIHHEKIALHQHHVLADSFNIKRLHFPESHRNIISAQELVALKNQGFILSTSIHDLEHVAAGIDLFDYAFYGPVFNSISKKGYEGVVTENFQVPSNKMKLVAIGGVDENNTIKAYKMGFHGVAVLGAIWQSSNPVESFRKIKKTCRLTAP